MGAADLLQRLRTTGFSVTADGGGIRVAPGAGLSADQRQAIRDHKPELLALLNDEAQARPYRLTPAQAQMLVADPPDEPASARRQARAAAIHRRGFNAQEATDLADVLWLRDLQGDHRHLCLECNHLAGSVLGGWRCGSHRAAQVGRDLPAVLVTMAQRCPGFAL